MSRQLRTRRQALNVGLKWFKATFSLLEKYHSAGVSYCTSKRRSGIDDDLKATGLCYTEQRVDVQEHISADGW